MNTLIGPTWIKCPSLEVAGPVKREREQALLSKTDRLIKWWFTYPIKPNALEILPELAERCASLVKGQIIYSQKIGEINQLFLDLVTCYPVKPLGDYHARIANCTRKLSYQLKRNTLDNLNAWIGLNALTKRIIDLLTPGALAPTAKVDVSYEILNALPPYQHLFVNGYFRDGLMYNCKMSKINAPCGYVEFQLSEGLILTKRIEIEEERASTFEDNYLKEFYAFPIPHEESQMHWKRLTKISEKHALCEQYIQSLLASIGVATRLPKYMAFQGEYTICAPTAPTRSLLYYASAGTEEEIKRLAAELVALLTIEAQYKIIVFDYCTMALEDNHLVAEPLKTTQILNEQEYIERKVKLLSYLEVHYKLAPLFVKLITESYPAWIPPCNEPGPIAILEMYRLASMYSTEFSLLPLQDLNKSGHDVADQQKIVKRIFELAATILHTPTLRFKNETDTLLDIQAVLEKTILEYFISDFLRSDLDLRHYFFDKWLENNDLLKRIHAHLDSLPFLVIPKIDFLMSNSALFDFRFWQFFHDKWMPKIAYIVKTPLASEILGLDLESPGYRKAITDAFHTHLMAYTRKKEAKFLLDSLTI